LQLGKVPVSTLEICMAFIFESTLKQDIINYDGRFVPQRMQFLILPKGVF